MLLEERTRARGAGAGDERAMQRAAQRRQKLRSCVWVDRVFDKKTQG